MMSPSSAAAAAGGGGSPPTKNSRKRAHRKKKTDDDPSTEPPAAARAAESSSTSENTKETDAALIKTLQTVDPILQFLTKATGQTGVPAPNLLRALPPTAANGCCNREHHLNRLLQLGILHPTNPRDARGEADLFDCRSKAQQQDEEESSTDASATSNHRVWNWSDANCWIGFPPPDNCNSNNNKNRLHGSTKTAAKRRMAALKQMLKQQEHSEQSEQQQESNCTDNTATRQPYLSRGSSTASRKNNDTTTTATVNPVMNQQHQASKPAVAEETEFCSASGDVAGDKAAEFMHEKVAARNEFDDCGDDDDDNSSENGSHLQFSRKEEPSARTALQTLFGFVDVSSNKEKKDSEDSDIDDEEDNSILPTTVLPRQASYAGSNPAQPSCYQQLSGGFRAEIPTALWKAFGLAEYDDKSNNNGSNGGHQLYSHQATAIEAALSNRHCSLGTGTGSGKSLCFWVPVLTAAYNHNHTSIVIFPTKALAQDQLGKLVALLQSNDDNNNNNNSNDLSLTQRIRAATLDGDTPHASRREISANSNVILTNPDTLHAAVLPHWQEQHYQTMLSRLRYIVVDEAHTYDGIFGAHVALILRRLVRVSAVARQQQQQQQQPTSNNNIPAGRPTFFVASATLPWPEHHFRLLCPLGDQEEITVLTSREDGSPRSAKHFFVWNPPVLRLDGVSTGKVYFPRPNKTTSGTIPASELTHCGAKRQRPEAVVSPTDSETLPSSAASVPTHPPDDDDDESLLFSPLSSEQQQQYHYHRRHAADETARLLARAVAQGVRCIAFCKTRNLVEWVYAKTVDALRSDTRTASLASKVDSYRGGYSLKERRKIEEHLFCKQVLGVVGTNALELGVDIGGIDVTLHCGYPSSYASLLQQAGRAGRDKSRLDAHSVSVVVCFNSPSEQQMWRRPQSLFGQGLSSQNTIPLRGDLVQGHLLCASEEFPLTGDTPVTTIVGCAESPSEARNTDKVPSDRELFGPSEYDESLQSLKATGSVVEARVVISVDPIINLSVFKARPAVRKAWSRLSIRSIEPVNYAIVDLSHPGQGGRMDGIHDSDAVLDTVPYSRVFYHAHPGAIITHRGRKYKITAMTQVPAFIAENFCSRRSLNLAAYAKPTSARYVTRPLSNLHITIIKQMESVQLKEESPITSESTAPASLKTDDNDKFIGNTTREEDSLVSSESPASAAANSGDKNDTSSGSTSNTQKELVITFAGCGAVNVKRNVHGYKKLSLINRNEISRSELKMPSIEYDTFGLYICTEPDTLGPMLGERYGPGVHALSHALLAVAPLFAHGLTRNDLECDHSFYAPTQVVLFDERAGGSGCVQRLWKYFFEPGKKNIVAAAVELLEECSMCRVAAGYDNGCPACLHASNCIKFNMHLSRSAAIIIGKRMLDRIQLTDLYKQNAAAAAELLDEPAVSTTSTGKDTTPRRKARRKAMAKAKDMHLARERQYVVGRPTWALDA